MANVMRNDHHADRSVQTLPSCSPFLFSHFLSHTSDIRNYNTRELTIIRKVLGDLHALRESIVRDFDVSEKHVVVKVPF